MRCLPDAPEVLYTDATCGTPVVGTCVGCAKPKYAAEVFSIGPSCESQRLRWRMHSVGDVVPSVSGLYAHSFTGTCYSTSTGTMTLRAVTDAVDSSSFVAFDSQWELHGALLAHVLVGSDGARYVTDLHDAKTLRPCGNLPSTSTAGGGCIPGPVGYGGYPGSSADPPCTETVASTSDPICPAAPLYFLLESSSPAIDYLFAVDGPAWTPLVTSKGTCTATSAKPGDWFMHGPVLVSLPWVAVVPQGTGAVRALFRGNDGEAIQPLGVLREESSGIQCSVMRFADGKLHCLTSRAWPAVYADAACTSPVIGIFGPSAAKPPATAAIYDVIAGEQVVRSLYDVGALHSLTTIYALDGGTCVARSPGSGTKYYDLGASHDLSSFAVITPVTE